MIEDVDVSTVDLAERGILTLDYAIHQVSESRSKIDTQINRFENIMCSLKIEEENLQANSQKHKTKQKFKINLKNFI